MLTELQKLRVSVARIAQALKVNGMTLQVTGLSYDGLCALAQTEERGWNDLAHACCAKATDTRAVEV